MDDRGGPVPATGRGPAAGGESLSPFSSRYINCIPPHCSLTNRFWMAVRVPGLSNLGFIMGMNVCARIKSAHICTY